MSDPLLFLHRALLDGDPTASRRLADACGARLHAILKRRHATLPRDLVVDAATDALLTLFEHPERYQPPMGSLMNYLTHIADYKIRDQLRSLQRRQEIAIGGICELARLEEATYRPTDSSANGLPDLNTLSPDLEALLCVTLPDPRDRQLWELICQGRTAVQELAVVLDITHLPAERQRAEVKRQRDRVVKRVLRRRGEFRRLLS